MVESYDGSTSVKDSTPLMPHNNYDGVGIGDTTSSVGNHSSALRIDTTAFIDSNVGNVSSPNVKFVDDSANMSATDLKKK